MKIVLSSFLFIITGVLAGQSTHNHQHTRKIIFPDILGYQTTVCDFHIHTVFSDGNVWPTIRVEEAAKDGVHAISMTEHLEYQPHLDDIPHPDRNRSYHIAKELANALDIIVVHGVEITRDLPPGHANAIFIEDANKLNVEDPIDAYVEAKRQGAFVFWNHPNWISQQRNGIATLTPLHDSLVKEGMLHGIEVVNDLTFSDEALEIAFENNLTVMGTSDIHGLVDWQFKTADGGHRPVSLVLTTERSEAAIEEALRAGRSIAFFDDLLIGKEEYVAPLIAACIEVGEATYQGPSSVVTVPLKNVCNTPITFQNQSDYTLHAHSDIIRIPAQDEIRIQVKTLEQLESFTMPFEVLSAVIGKNKHPVVDCPVEVNLDK